MPKFFLKKTDKVYIPCDDNSIEITNKLDAGTIVSCEAWKERNYRFHKKYFALLNIVFENQKKYDNFEAFRAEVIMRAGYFNMHIHLSGQQSFSPKSIAFKNMDEIEFEKLYSKTIDVILKHFLVGTTDEEIRKEVEIIVGFS